MERLRDGEAKCPIKITATGWEIRDVVSSDAKDHGSSESHLNPAAASTSSTGMSRSLVAQPSFSRPSLPVLRAPFPIPPRSAGLGGPSKAIPAPLEMRPAFQDRCALSSQNSTTSLSV